MHRRSLVVGIVIGVVLAALVFVVASSRKHGHSAPARTSLASVSAEHSGGSDIVHATASGKRYHRAGCRSLSRSDIPMPRAEAERRGLTPCKVCRP
jgi:MFS superfamily sulfate permease-like transporter